MIFSRHQKAKISDSRRTLRAALIALPLLGSITRTSTASASHPGDLPKKFQRSPYNQMSLSIGSPTRGWQLRAKRIRPSGSLRLKNPERGYVYGHPALVLMLHRASRQMAKDVAGSVLLVGDLSRKQGGPLAGHRSHQSGRDVDIGFFVLGPDQKPRQLKDFVSFNGDGRARDGSGLVFDDYRNWLLVQLLFKDHRARVRHVFVSTPLRERLLSFARERPAFRQYHEQAAKILTEPQNSSAHDDHFHVRIACPKRQQELCVEYAVESD